MLSTLRTDDANIQNSLYHQQDVFLRHRGPITCACPIPNSVHVITSAYDGAVGLFNTQTKAVDLLGYHAHLVNRVSTNDQGTLAASCSSDFNIHLWDLQSKKLRRVLKGHSDDVEDFVFIDDQFGASVSRDWRVLIWNLHTGAIEHVFLGHSQDVLSVTHLDGRLYTSGDDMTLRIWDLTERTIINTLGPFETEADTCTIDPVHRRVVLGCDDGVIRVFDIDTGDLISAINAHQAGIKKVACSPSNGDILSAAYDQRILIWDATDLNIKQELQYHVGTWERSFNWSADGQSIYAGTFNGTVTQWNAISGACETEYGSQDPSTVGSTIDSTIGNACFNDLALLPNQTVIAVSDDGLVRIGKLSEDQALWQHTHVPKTGRILMNAVTTQFTDNAAHSAKVITGAHDQSLHYFEVNQNTVTQTHSINLQQGPINCARIAQQADFQGQCFVACYTGAILHVDCNGKVINDIRVHDNAVKALTLHPTEAIGVSCSADGTLASWDFEGNLLHIYPGHLAIIDDVSLSANGKLIASAGRDFTLKIHRLADGALLHNIGLGRRSPKALEFIGNDVVIVTNYWGELLRVSLKDESVTCRKIAENGISGIAIRNGQQEDHQIIASSYDGGIYLVRAHDLQTLNCLRSMTQRVNSPAFEL